MDNITQCSCSNPYAVVGTRPRKPKPGEEVRYKVFCLYCFKSGPESPSKTAAIGAWNTLIEAERAEQSL
jgi:hypothetical protein